MNEHRRREQRREEPDPSAQTSDAQAIEDVPIWLTCRLFISSGKMGARLLVIVSIAFLISVWAVR